MSEDREPTSPIVRVAAVALALFVAPLFFVQAVVFGGVVLSANGFGRFVPGLSDVDGDGFREIVIGQPDDVYAVCEWTDLGPVHVATSCSTSTAYPEW